MPKTTHYQRAELRREALPSVISGAILGIVLVLGILFSPDYSNEQPTTSTASTTTTQTK